MDEVTIDEAGRIVIPNLIRSELNLRPGQKLKVSAVGHELVISPEVGTGEFVVALKGCVKGSTIEPEALKETLGLRASSSLTPTSGLPLRPRPRLAPDDALP